MNDLTGGSPAAEDTPCRPRIIRLLLVDNDILVLAERAGAIGQDDDVVKPPSRPELERAIAIARASFADWRELRRFKAGPQASPAEAKSLTGLLPICSGCKKIRDDQGCWREIEDYIRSRARVEFSHGICPDCRERLYPDLDGAEG
jgi:hypothetical protein